MPTYKAGRAAPVRMVVKDPDAVLDYQVDFSDYLQTDETLTAATFILEDGVDLVKDSESFTDTTATIWLSGGTVDTEYTLICRFSTSNLRTDDRSFIIPVKQR